jgi:N-acetylglucosaminyl transferase component (Gpi1)
VLRNRVEPTDYDLDQLLLGSILFTLAAFLFPTVLAYYLVFAAVRPRKAPADLSLSVFLSTNLHVPFSC